MRCEPPEFGDAREQPGQLGVLAHVALAKEDAARRVEARGEQDRRRVVHALAQLRGVVGDGQRVQVDDAEDALAALLARDVLGDRADVVAQVLAPGGLDAGEDAHVAAAQGGVGAARARPSRCRPG